MCMNWCSCGIESKIITLNIIYMCSKCLHLIQGIRCIVSLDVRIAKLYPMINDGLSSQSNNVTVPSNEIKCIVVSVGMRIAYRYFPDGLMTGTPSQTVTENPKPPKTKEKASQKSFTTFDLEKLHTQLDSQLSDRSVGSKSTVLSLHFHLI